jgi:hypothetical protein
VIPISKLIFKRSIQLPNPTIQSNLLLLVVQSDGILLEDFGELLTTSGLVCDPRICWITFHSCFDFGYLIRAIMLGNLPENEKDFYQ